MSGLIGKKIGMTSLYDEEGKNLACTVIQAGPCIVTQVKNEEKDGYNSVQLGFFDKKDVSGISKGKGFQGVVKRHGFAGVGQSTHGQHNRLRAPGSIGAASYPARVFKGMRMAGQTGNSKVTVQNLKVLKVIPEKNLLVLKGAVPGHKNSFIVIRK